MMRVLLALFILLSGCAQLPQPTPIAQQEAIGIAGRLSITQPGRRDSGGFRYDRLENEQRWVFFGPTGGELGQLRIRPDGASWTPSKGTALYATDAQALSQQALGIQVPLQRAGDWLMGQMPSPDELLPWTLRYTRQDELGRPRIIDLNNAEVRLRAVIKTWQYSPN